MIIRWRDFFYQTQGPLSQDLELVDSSLVRGQVPKKLLPEKIVRSICGFCSTGCCLDIHVKKGEAVNVTPTYEYPVNLGFACPKGWEALAPLKAAAPRINQQKFFPKDLITDITAKADWGMARKIEILKLATKPKRIMVSRNFAVVILLSQNGRLVSR